LLGLLADKEDPSGAGRRRTEDRGKALAGKSTLNRLELTPKETGKQDRYKKIVAQTEAMDTLLVEVFVESHAVPPKEIVIDVEAFHSRQVIAIGELGSYLSYITTSETAGIRTARAIPSPIAPHSAP